MLTSAHFVVPLDPTRTLLAAAAEGEDRIVPVEVMPGEITHMRESMLERRVGGHEDDNEIAIWVEYRLIGKLVHRSAHVHLKKAGNVGAALAAALG